MRCSKLMIIYGIFFLFSTVILMYENYTLKCVKQECDRIENALGTAADAAEKTFAASVYEEGTRKMVGSVFEYIFEMVYLGDIDETGQSYVKEIVFLNDEGMIMGDAEFDELKKGDRVMISFVLDEIEIDLPGRRVSTQKGIERLVVLD